MSHRTDIINLLEKSIMWIEQPCEGKPNTQYPYTRSSIPEIGFTYDRSKLTYNRDTYICYNIITQEYTTLEFENTNDYMSNPDMSECVGLLLYELEKIQAAIDECPQADIKTIKRIKYTPSLHGNVDLVFRSYIDLEFRVEDLKDIFSECDSTTMQSWQEWYMNKVRNQRLDSLRELDELYDDSKAAGAEQEDLDDIETIKQMFRDIPQQIDLSQYNTPHDLLKSWPSLLLPSPIKLQSKQIKDVLFSSDLGDNEHILQLLGDLLSTIDDKQELQLFLQQTKQADDLDLPEEVVKLVEQRIQELD